jgi:hypothetical protein
VLPGGFKLNKVQTTLMLDFAAQLMFGESEGIQNGLAALVDGAIQGRPSQTTAGLAGIRFGVNQQDHVDTFAKISVRLMLEPLISAVRPAIARMVNGALSGQVPSIPAGMQVNKLDVDVVQNNAFGIEADVSLSGLPGQISANLPFISAGVVLDGRNLLTSIINIRLVQNRLLLSMQTPFVKDPIVASRLFEVVQAIVVRNPTGRRYAVRFPIAFGIQSILMGASAQAHSRMISRVRVSIPFDQIITSVIRSTQNKPLVFLDDMISMTTPDGIFALNDIVAAPGVPLKLLFKEILLEVRCYSNNREAVFTTAIVKTVKYATSTSPMKSVLVGTSGKPQEVAPCVVDLLTYAFTGQDFAQHARLGWTRMIGSNGAVFDALEAGILRAPELYFMGPWSVEAKLTDFSLAGFAAGKIPLDVTLGVKTGNIIGVDAGQTTIQVTNSGRPLLHITNGASMVILNGRQSAAGGPNPLNGTFRTALKIPKLNDIGSLLDFKKYGIDVKLTMGDGAPVRWLNEGIANMGGDAGNLRKIGPALLTFLSSIQYDILGLKFNGIPALKDLIPVLQPILDQMGAAGSANLTELIRRDDFVLDESFLKTFFSSLDSQL